jgi:signal transduction histidine kinase
VAIARQRAFDRRLGLGPRHDEVGQIANTIDHLLLTVEETLHSHRQFVADTSHELRNPLLAIHTNLELLDRVNDPADRAECVREAREQVERMSRLVADLIVLARTDAGELVERRPVALRPLVERVACEARRHATGHRVCVERAADVVVQGDAHRLTQILTNLVDNATRHTPSGGTIRLGLNREDGWVCVYVSDSGEGIPPEHLPHLFNRFYQVDRAGGGVGLGLSIVKHLAEAHGGRVEVESEPGRGSCFTVWLPVEDAARLARA